MSKENVSKQKNKQSVDRKNSSKKGSSKNSSTKKNVNKKSSKVKKFKSPSDLTTYGIMAFIMIMLAYIGSTSDRKTTKMFEPFLWGVAKEGYNAMSIWGLVILVFICFFGFIFLKNDSLVGMKPRKTKKTSQGNPSEESSGELSEQSDEETKDISLNKKTDIMDSVEEGTLQDVAIPEGGFDGSLNDSNDFKDVAERYASMERVQEEFVPPEPLQTSSKMSRQDSKEEASGAEPNSTNSLNDSKTELPQVERVKMDTIESMNFDDILSPSEDKMEPNQDSLDDILKDLFS